MALSKVVKERILNNHKVREVMAWRRPIRTQTHSLLLHAKMMRNSTYGAHTPVSVSKEAFKNNLRICKELLNIRDKINHHTQAAQAMADLRRLAKELRA